MNYHDKHLEAVLELLGHELMEVVGVAPVAAVDGVTGSGNPVIPRIAANRFCVQSAGVGVLETGNGSGQNGKNQKFHFEFKRGS